MKQLILFSVPISITTRDEALAVIGEWLKEWKGVQTENDELRMANKKSRSVRSTFPKIITTPNPEMIVAAQKDAEFLRALQSADLAVPDGWGVVRALCLKRRNRLPGLELMEDLINLAAKNNWRVLLLGGRPGIAAAAADKLRAANRNLNIVSLSGPRDINRASSFKIDHLITSINHIKPHLLFAAFGHGKQEPWLTANRRRLNAGAAMGVGGALDQIADPGLRPPPYINGIGLGWLYRLFRQPRRWRRQLALIKFVWMIKKARLNG